jgi:mitochondrial-processing peptidase subunit alpha
MVSCCGLVRALFPPVPASMMQRLFGVFVRRGAAPSGSRDAICGYRSFASFTRPALNNILPIHHDAGADAAERVAATTEKGTSQHLPTLDLALPGLPSLSPASDLDAPETELSTLPNGLRVVSQETYGQVTTVGVLVHTGSRFEALPMNRGNTHVLESMAFKSTTNRTHADVVRELEDLGVFPNTVSAREEIMYQIDVMRDRVPKAFEIFADVVRNPLFDEAEVEEAKQIIGFLLEDMAETPQTLVNEELMCTAFGRDTPMGQSLLCDTNRLKEVTGAGLKSFTDAHYCAENLVVSFAGLAHDEAVALAAEYFGDMPSKSSIPGVSELRAGALAPPQYTGGVHLQSVPNLPFTHVGLAFDAGGWHDDDLVPVCVLHSLLGGGDSFSAGGPGKGMYSRLYRQVLNRQYWVESVLGVSLIHSDCGITGIVGSSEASYSPNMLAMMCYQMKDLARNAVDPVELSRARNRLKSSVLMSLESRMLLAEDLARQVLTYGFREETEKLMAKIDSVSEDDLIRVANRAINSKPTIVVYGDTSAIPANVAELVEATLHSP